MARPRRRGRKKNNVTIQKQSFIDDSNNFVSPRDLHWNGMPAITNSGTYFTKSSGKTVSMQKMKSGIPKPEDSYTRYNDWIGMQHSHLRVILENDSTLQTIFTKLPNTIFKGKIRWEEEYGSKCPICGYTTDKHVDDCEDCNQRLTEMEELLGISEEQPESEESENNVLYAQSTDLKLQAEYEKLKEALDYLH